MREKERFEDEIKEYQKKKDMLENKLTETKTCMQKFYLYKLGLSTLTSLTDLEGDDSGRKRNSGSRFFSRNPMAFGRS
jgi:hypothetical protein